MYHVASCKQDGQARLDELSKTAAHPHKLQQQYAMIESSIKGCGCHVNPAADAHMHADVEAKVEVNNHQSPWLCTADSLSEL